MTTVGAWKDSALDARILDEVSKDAPWALVERFNTLHRLSGSADEAVAVDYITGKLSEWGVQHTVHHPKLLISWPGPTTLRTTGPNGKSYTVKTVSFSPSTNGAELVGELVYVPGREPSSLRDMFRTETGRQPIEELDLRGKIVISEGRGMGARNLDLAASGAIAAIMVNPGERIHEGIATNSWGSPDLRSLGRTPAIPILAINRPEGRELIELAQQGPVEVAFSNQVDTGWREIPVIVAEIPGAQVPEEFVLLHGHLDSWHVGVGDNATGDATLLELARVFQANKDKLARSLRIAWWSGHSHGRYAGSTWYADTFAIDLMENCVSHLNCDSPGCRWATVYEDVMWMPEAEELARAAIRDAVDQEATTMRPLRAGDNSFNNLGISLYFMGSSWMPSDRMAEKGYHPVAGCGGNIAWHTEDDTLEIADPDILLKDIKIYALAVLRSLNAPVHPLDYRAAVVDIRGHVQSYQEAAGDGFDFTPALAELNELQAALDRFYSHLELSPPIDAAAARDANRVQRKLARELVGLSFSQDGRFRQDTARSFPPLPEFQPARQLQDAADDMKAVIAVDLTRAQNRFRWACREARRDVQRFMAGG
jgi:hypothetical protein